jgi:hypothetical protein
MIQWWDNFISRGEAEMAQDFDGVPWLIFAVVTVGLLAIIYGLLQLEVAVSGSAGVRV